MKLLLIKIPLVLVVSICSFIAQASNGSGKEPPDELEACESYALTIFLAHEGVITIAEIDSLINQLEDKYQFDDKEQLWECVSNTKKHAIALGRLEVEQ